MEGQVSRREDGVIQSQVLFWGLYAVAIYLVATKVGIGFAAFVFRGWHRSDWHPLIVGLSRRRNR